MTSLPLFDGSGESNQITLDPKHSQVLALFDLDGTITEVDTYLKYLLGFARRRPRFWRWFALPFDVLRFKLGMKDNTWLKQRFLNAIFGGISRDEVNAWTETYLDQVMRSWLRAGAMQQIATHQQRGDRIIMITASPDLYVDALARRLGFSECLCTATRWTTEDRISGQLAGPNCYGLEKIKRIKILLSDNRDEYFIISYSDHHSDLPLLNWSDCGIVVNPNNRFARQARATGLVVVTW